MESMNPGPANLKPSLCGECQLEPPASAYTVEGQVAISQVDPRPTAPEGKP